MLHESVLYFWFLKVPKSSHVFDDEIGIMEL